MSRVRSERGNLSVELMVAMPVYIIALVIMMNVLLFVSECARFDRAAGEVARAATRHSGSEGEAAGLAKADLQRCLGYSSESRFNVTVEVEDSPSVPLLVTHSKVRCTLTFTPWPSGGGTFFGFAPTVLVRTKEFLIDRYQPGIIFG